MLQAKDQQAKEYKMQQEKEQKMQQARDQQAKEKKMQQAKEEKVQQAKVRCFIIAHCWILMYTGGVLIWAPVYPQPALNVYLVYWNFFPKNSINQIATYLYVSFYLSIYLCLPTHMSKP